jgi:hypothetical protein
MTHRTPHFPDIAFLDRATHSLRLWVLDVLAMLADLLGGGFRTAVRAATRGACADVKLLVVGYAVQHRLAAAPLASERRHGAPRGFRHARARRCLRAFTRGVRVKTLDDVRPVLGDLDAVVARMVARFARARVRRRLAAAALVAERVISPCVRAACADDTS